MGDGPTKVREVGVPVWVVHEQYHDQSARQKASKFGLEESGKGVLLDTSDTNRLLPSPKKKELELIERMRPLLTGIDAPHSGQPQK